MDNKKGFRHAGIDHNFCQIAKMKFQEYDLVRILKDCEEGVRKGEVGTVLLSFENPVEAYEVEFLDETGRQKAQCTLFPEDLQLVR